MIQPANQPSLTILARHTLSRGATPAATYALLARLGHKPVPCAQAICLALDIPPAETARRLEECHDALLANPRPDTESDTGELLEALGVFDVPQELDETGHAVVALLLAAIDAMGGIRPGHQHGLQRWITTGKITTAYLSLAATHPLPRTGDPGTYWSSLTAAGELLTAAAPRPDARVKNALTHCRTQATHT
ncbi:hypothetical protein ACFRAR_05435 [Kitasatospora sp. NPDC056651]|uniref:hypothetical protein n=1 Tax=Kitasatospora sp. NPDC056651 TaxID=3345892 RepID=UPI0036AA82C1